MTSWTEPSEANEYLADYVSYMLQSLHRFAQMELVEADVCDVERAQQAFAGDFFLVSHNARPDPKFVYGNRSALRLFEMTWAEFTNLRSKFSAEADAREERQRILARVETSGYCDQYSGVRISKGGKRFRIENAVLWNVMNGDNQRIGQAAVFWDITYL